MSDYTIKDADELRSLFATLDNSAMLCAGEDNAISEAFIREAYCPTCGKPKAPKGRSMMDTFGYCTRSCPSYWDTYPFPPNLHAIERMEIRELVHYALETIGYGRREGEDL